MGKNKDRKRFERLDSRWEFDLGNDWDEQLKPQKAMT